MSFTISFLSVVVQLTPSYRQDDLETPLLLERVGQQPDFMHAQDVS